MEYFDVQHTMRRDESSFKPLADVSSKSENSSLVGLCLQVKVAAQICHAKLAMQDMLSFEFFLSFAAVDSVMAFGTGMVGVLSLVGGDLREV